MTYYLPITALIQRQSLSVLNNTCLKYSGIKVGLLASSIWRTKASNSSIYDSAKPTAVPLLSPFNSVSSTFLTTANPDSILSTPHTTHTYTSQHSNLLHQEQASGRGELLTACKDWFSFHLHNTSSRETSFERFTLEQHCLTPPLCALLLHLQKQLLPHFPSVFINILDTFCHLLTNCF